MLKLSKSSIKNIESITKHCRDNTESTHDEITEYNRILQLINRCNLTIGLTINNYDIVKQTQDLIFNMMVTQILTELAKDDDSEYITFETAMYDYIVYKYGFDNEEHSHYLLKATPEEALAYVAEWITNHESIY